MVLVVAYAQRIMSLGACYLISVGALCDVSLEEGCPAGLALMQLDKLSLLTAKNQQHVKDSLTDETQAWGTDCTFTTENDTNINGPCTSAPGSNSDMGGCSDEADCKTKCNADAKCLGYIDMFDLGYGYQRKNYVGPDCTQNRVDYKLNVKVGTCGAANVKGDPHTLFNGTMTDFHLPVDHYTELIHQGSVGVFAKGGPRGSLAKNFIHSMSIVVDNTEVLHIDRISQHVRTEKRSLIVTAHGAEIRAGTSVRLEDGSGKFKVTHSKVIVEIGGFKFLVASQKTKSSGSSEAFPNHLDITITDGLQMDQATGVLPELWGLRPKSKQTSNMILATRTVDASHYGTVPYTE